MIVRRRRIGAKFVTRYFGGEKVDEGREGGVSGGKTGKFARVSHLLHGRSKAASVPTYVGVATPPGG